jgi:glycosyltransferase involved in cell wall biosynthesis
MRVLIDARKIDDGGIGTYIRNLVTGILEVGTAAEVGIICGASRTIPAQWRGAVAVHLDETPCYSLSELLLFPRKSLLRQYDLFHVPHYTLPLALDVPTVVTVHDLIHVNHPETWYHRFVASRLVRSALRRADRVLTVSEATRRELVDLVGGDPRVLGKIRVVPNALAQEFAAYETGDHRTAEPYLLSVCSTEKAHKGTRELLEAFSILKSHSSRTRSSRSGAAIKLKVVGKGASAQRLRSMPVAANDDIEFLGEVSSAELCRLYAGATALVVASRAEGFCLPVLEAQARHVPVISTPIPAVEDLVTHQDTLADDFSPQALAQAMRRALERGASPVTEEMRGQYARHLARFDRQKVAAEVLSVYGEAIEGEGRSAGCEVVR